VSVALTLKKKKNNHFVTILKKWKLPKDDPTSGFLVVSLFEIYIKSHLGIIEGNLVTIHTTFEIHIQKP
jgi:hypothetical protein